MGRNEYKFFVGIGMDLDISAYSEEEAWDIIGRIARQVQQEVEGVTDIDTHAWWDMK